MGGKLNSLRANLSVPSEELRHVALLRGINVGGNNKIAMADLRSIFCEAGASDVSSYIQSGNVCFSCEKGDAPAIREGVLALLESRAKIECSMILRAKDEFLAISEQHPFSSEAVDPKFLHLYFLQSAPDSSRALETMLPSSVYPNEPMQLLGRELFVHYARGVARSPLTIKKIEKALGTKATARNWRSVQALAKMLQPTPAD